MRKQYKETISKKQSDYRRWSQLEHAEEYVLYPEKLGHDMDLDETCLSNGDVYTILTNKAAHGGKGALAAMIRRVASDTVSSILKKMSIGKRILVKTMTTDLSSAMMLTVMNVFPACAEKSADPKSGVSRFLMGITIKISDSKQEEFFIDNAS